MNTYVVNRYNKPTSGATSQVINAVAGSSADFEFGAFKDETRVIYMTLTGDGLMMTIDGSTPTTSNSHRLYAGNSYYFNKDLVDVAKFKIHPSNTATAILYASELTN